MTPRTIASLRVIMNVLITASTTNAVDAALAVSGVTWLDCTPTWISTRENSLIWARLMAGSKLARRPCCIR